MTSKYFVPLIFLSTAIGQIHRGELGLAIVLLCAVAVALLVDWFFEEDRQRAERKRREAEAERRRSRGY